MTESTRAVFLSYASQDGPAAQKICEALRAAGIEVWFDQSELRGGDAWDHRIREQIHTCRLFIAVISANSEHREEGYFRREWGLAVDRTRDMAHKRAFLVPVVIDGTPERGASVPEKFHDLQWTRLPKGETPPAFVERIQHLLSPESPTGVRPPASAEAGLPGTMPAPAQASRSPNRGLLVAVAVVVLGAVAYLAIDKPWISRSAMSLPTVAASPVPAASVAVVPFTNLTGEAGKEYFSDGMAEELINELTKVPGLKVPARTSSFAYKGRNIDIRQIARDLGVATILEGSVRSAGERIRVTAQLINAQTGYHIWSNTYDGDFGDVFKVQDDISAQIVEALKTSMNVQLPALSTRPAPTSDPEAYRLYLQASSAFLSGSIDVALRLATQATVRDPRFARAWAFKASVRANVATLFPVTGNVMEEVEHDATQALALDPSLAEAQTALGIINALRGDWIAAEASFRRAAELAPNDPYPHGYRALLLLASAGHVRQALEEQQETYALAPASTVAISMLASFYSLRAQNREALKYADLAAQLGGSHNNMIEVTRQEVALRNGHCGEAADLILPALPVALRSPDGISTVRQVFAAMCAPNGRETAARALTALVRSVGADALPFQSRMGIVSWYAMLGDLNGAFEFANRTLDELARSGNVEMSWPALWTPEMRSFRKDPRFQQFVSRLKLFDYWKQYGPPDDCDLRGDVLVCR